MIVRVPGRERGRPILFSAHMDVVDARPEDWERSPVQLVAEHEWVRGAEFAINTDAGGGLLDDATGKPLIYLVQGAEKTYATFELTVTNPGGHSSRPRARTTRSTRSFTRSGRSRSTGSR